MSLSIVAAALRACRRVNDFSLTTRILEVVRIKCGNREAEIWPYMMQVTCESVNVPESDLALLRSWHL